MSGGFFRKMYFGIYNENIKNGMKPEDAKRDASNQVKDAMSKVIRKSPRTAKVLISSDKSSSKKKFVSEMASAIREDVKEQIEKKKSSWSGI